MSVTITVLSPDLTPLGLINKFTALTWTSRTTTYGGFELYCPVLTENSELLKPENLVWIGGDEAGVIETILKQTDDEGNITLQVTGRFVECYLGRRIIYGEYQKTAIVSTHIQNMVDQNAINPTDTRRIIPLLALDPDQQPLGPSVSFCNSYGVVWDTVTGLASSNGLLVRVKAEIPSKALKMTVQETVDRSVEQTDRPAVVLSTDLSDILNDSYTRDATAWCDMAIVAGAGEGADRKIFEVNPDSSGLDRRELYVDARDLQDYEDWDATIRTTTFILDSSTNQVQIVTNTVRTNPETGEKVTTETTETKIDPNATAGVVEENTTLQIHIDDDTYNGILEQRGKEKLLETPLVESFNANIRMYGSRAYEYGVDYFLGDRVTMQDSKLQIQVSTEISEVSQTWDESGYSVAVALGTTAPTITQLIRRKG